MPTFFNDSDLPDDQEDRYDEALEKYGQIQKNNADQQKERLKNVNKLTSRAEKEIEFSKNYHQPGDKSSLFYRLLQGKEPLSEPPPTNYGYPWYEVIEEEGPWNVSVNGSSTLDSYVNVPFFTKKQRFIAINQCFWAVRSTNKAGRKFLKINNPDNNSHTMKTIFSKPEFIVFYHGWQDFLLKVGRVKIQGRRENILSERFSLEHLGTNATILNVQRTGESLIEEEKNKRNSLLNKPEELYTSTERLLAISYKEPMIIPDIPTDWDWVEAEVDSWVLEKIPRN